MVFITRKTRMIPRERSYAPTVQRRSEGDPVLYRIKVRNLGGNVPPEKMR